MSKNKFDLILGIILICMPFLGFPLSLKINFSIFAGVILVLVSVLGHFKRRSAPMMPHHEHIHEEQVFVEQPEPQQNTAHVVHVKISEEN